MPTRRISGGTAHILPKDMREALLLSPQALAAWEDITPLARNEWICWSISVKSKETRKQHIARMVAELKAGKRRPCCWMGCVHRKDKLRSPSQTYILGRGSKKK